MNFELVKTIRETQAAAEKCTRELLKVCRRYDLTPEGAEGERQKLYEVVKKTQEEAEAKVTALITIQIAKIDDSERKAAEQRAADTDYMSRLQMKISMIGSIDLQKVDNATLAAMFAEFKDDPLALEMISAAIPGGRSVLIEPENNYGKRQEHLREVEKAVIRALRKAGAYISPSDLENNSIPFKSEVDALVLYIREQNEDFSKNDKEVWEKIVYDYPETKVEAWLWQTRFSNSR